MKKMNVKTKFQIGSACILLLFCAVVSSLAYLYMKKSTTDSIYKETEIFIATADATRTYVKDVLRPKVLELMPPDGFIPHAMSTSYVGREVMNRLRKRFPDFRYKRAALNPMNPINQANAFEMEMINWFNANKAVKEWHGVMQEGDRSYYTRLRAIFAEPECIYCHGDPRDAPMDMKAIYGIKGGYGYSIGDVVAADTIYIPIDVTFDRIKEMSLMIFFMVITSLFSLLALFYLLFNRTVVLELKDMVVKFQNISGKASATRDSEIESAGDEVAQLKQAFEMAAVDLEEAHEELKTSEAKYRRLFETSQDAILIFDDDTRLIDINPAGIKLFGFKNHREAVEIETLYQLFWDPNDAKIFVDTVRTNGFIQDLEVIMVDRSGRKMTIRITATARFDENNRFSGINSALRDRTERVRMEKYMAQTEKLASIGQLASGVAHEINNPLEVIRLYTNLIAKAPDINEQVLKDLGIIQKHTEHCKHIMQALLDFARISAPKKLKSDIHDVIEDVLSVFELQIRNKPLKIDKFFTHGIPSVTLDVQQLKQVFINILINAAQSMPEGGAITIRTDTDRSGTHIRIEISDTGSGISQKHIDKIFDPFFTTKTNGMGTGLGLSVSYGIVKQHNGEIEIESTPGQGSTFTVILPTDDAQNPKPAR